VDEGLPIAYEVLEKGVPVYASGGEQVGTVHHVVSAEREDIFHGVVIRTASKKRFVAADQVASIHERGVDLTIDAAGAAGLPEPRGGAPSFRANEPGTKPSRWTEMLDLLRLRDPHRRDWSEED
jgi:sporulation protein YlmC with PRC-barrel domain